MGECDLGVLDFFEQNVIGQTRRADAEVDQTPSTAPSAPPCSPSFSLVGRAWKWLKEAAEQSSGGIFDGRTRR